MTTQQNQLLHVVRDALAGGVAIRAVNKLLPAEGEGGKVMPPTFSERQYAWEDRERGVIILDSVASHANRQEVLLGQDWQKLKLSILRLRFTNDQGHPLQEITSYQASHRVFDALFRDALLDGKPFRAPLRAAAPETAPSGPPAQETAGAGGKSSATQQKSSRARGGQVRAGGKESPAGDVSEVGRSIEESTLEYATPLYQFGPHCLIYGCWDSTGSARGEGSKFARAVESRVTGHNARLLQGTRGKLDVARLPSVPVYLTASGGWTDDPDHPEVVRDEKQEPVRFRLKGNSKGVLSELNHSSVTPNVRDHKSKQPLAGGVTIDHAYQRWVLSIPALRALSFPETKAGNSNEQRDQAARTVLALLGLCGLSRLWDKGLWFRSSCTLYPEAEPQIEFVYGRGRQGEKFAVTTEQVDEAYRLAVKVADQHDLKMRTEPIDLTPAANLREAYLRSRSGLASDDEESGPGGEA